MSRSTVGWSRTRRVVVAVMETRQETRMPLPLLRSLARCGLVVTTTVVLAGAGCLSAGPARRQPAGPPPPATEAVTEPEAPATAPSEAELTPTIVVPTHGGAGNLVLLDDHLHWLTRHFAPNPTLADGGESTAPGSGGAHGAVLDCERTRGRLWSVSTSPGSTEAVIATMDDWPWSLGAGHNALFWIGSCSQRLSTVAVGGGEPRTLGRADLAIVDYEPTADGVIVADRFGTDRGLFIIETATGATRSIAAPGAQPRLFGTLDGITYWGAVQGERTTVSTVGGGRDAQTTFAVDGHPMNAVVRDGAIFVLTTRAVVRLDPQGAHALASVTDYGDRGNLAVDATTVYWGNGKSGTISRVGRDGTGLVEVYVGGEPCGVAVHGTTLYWLDRAAHNIVQVHRALFDDPPPIPPPPPEPEPVSRIVDGDDPPPGLTLTASGTLIKVRGGWAVDVTLEAAATGESSFWLRTNDPVSVSGHGSMPDGSARTFIGSCFAPGMSGFELKPGKRRAMSVRHGESGEPAVRPGEFLKLEVGLCWVLRQDGKLQRAIAGSVVIDATGKGRPVVAFRPH